MGIKVYMIMRHDKFIGSVKMVPYKCFGDIESAKQHLRDTFKFVEQNVSLKVHGNPNEFPIRVYQTFPIREINGEVFEIHELEIEGI